MAGKRPLVLASFGFRKRILCLTSIALAFGSMCSPSLSQTVTATIPTGTSPGGSLEGIAINLVTNKIYVPNLNSNNVTVIDGATHNATTVAVGTNPAAV